jgi:hypothetical protein
MISDSEDLEKQLQENLKLRRELVAEVAKSQAASEPGEVGLPLRLGPLLLVSLYRLGHWLGRPSRPAGQDTASNRRDIPGDFL